MAIIIPVLLITVIGLISYLLSTYYVLGSVLSTLLYYLISYLHQPCKIKVSYSPHFTDAETEAQKVPSIRSKATQ